jgi:iron complex outermembrane recepter protein
MMSKKLLVRALGATALACVFAAPAFADDTAQTAPAVTQPAKVKRAQQMAIEEVVVTARRRAEDLEKVPVAVTALSADKLRQQDVKTAIDLQNLAPSLSVVGNLGSRDTDVFSIRGQNQPFGGADPGVQTYFAEIPFNASGAGTYFDLANVQVLNGPQGTLFGRSTTGGAVLFEPQRPTDQFGGYVDTQVGDFGLHELSGAINVPISGDTLMARAAFDMESRDGFTTDNVIPFGGGTPFQEEQDNVDYQAFRIGVTWKPFSHFSNYLVFDYLHDHNNGTGSALTGVNENTFANLAAQFNGGPCTNPPTTSICTDLAFFNLLLHNAYLQQQANGPRSVFADIPTFYKREEWSAIDIATYDLGDNMQLKNIFGYLSDKEWPQFDYSGTDLPLIDISNPNTWESNSIQVSEELQWIGSSFGGDLNWIVGGYHELDHPGGPSEIQQDEFGGGAIAPPISATVDETLTNGGTSDAVYASGTYSLDSLLHGLSFTAGGRYTWDHKVATDLSCTQNGSQPNPCPWPLTGPLVTGPTTQTANFHAPTWNLAAQDQVTDDTMVYATYRRGYKSGGFNSGAGNATDYEEFQPEYLTDVEVGTKNNWTILGVPGRTNFDMYYGWYQNVQKNDLVEVQQQVPIVPPPAPPLPPYTTELEGISALTFNAAQANIKGLEFQSTFIPDDNFQVDVFYSYTDATYQKFVLPQYILINTAGAQMEENPTNLAGGAFGYTPKNKAGITPRFHIPVDPSFGEPFISATAYWQSKEWFTDLGAEETINPAIPGEYGQSPEQKAYMLVNFRVDWNNVMGYPFDVSGFLNNAFDKVYAVGANALLNETATSSTIYGQPRMMGIELRYRFGADANSDSSK